MITKKNVLIVTPYSDFGAIVNQSLSNDPSLNGTVASTKNEIEACLKNKIAYKYALVDLDLGESKVLELGLSLRGNFPNIDLVLISKKEPSMGMDELRPWKILRKPFVQNDLDNIFHGKVVDTKNRPTVIDLQKNEWVDATPHTWWDDGKLITKTLVSAISNLNIQEAILFSKEEILAQAGKMDGAAVEECSSMVGMFKLEKDTSEILKPVHLQATKTNHFIHANILAVGILLAVLYDADTPLKDIRVQSRQLTQILKNPRLEKPTTSEAPVIRKIHLDLHQSESGHAEASQGRPSSGGQRVRHPRLIHYSSQFRKEQKLTDEVQKSEPATLRDILTAEKQAPSIEIPKGVRVKDASLPSRGLEFHLPLDGEARQKTDWLEDTLKWASPSVKAPKLEHHFSLCSPELSLFDLYYTCLLIPRLKSQSLDGDITDFLKETLPELFLANGWRLEAMDIGPSFLQWMVRIPPTIAPDDHINNIRTQSSRKILGNFSRLNRDELLKDFWAPGYLLGSGQSLFGAEDIIEFIRLNRNHYYPEDGVYNIPGSKFQVSHEKY